MKTTTKLNDTIQGIAEDEIEQYARYIKKVKEINEMKTMEEILKDVKESFDDESLPYETRSNEIQAMFYNKIQLADEIEEGFITDVEKAKKWLELIELIYEWSLDDEFEMEHRLHFDEGVLELDSISECCGGDWILDYKDGVLYINDEDFGDSILHLLNYIESTL